MKKKKGFTLAEVLITLGIIGVVSALTAPALMQNIGGAKVGPTLSKVVATIEVANEQLMNDNQLTSLMSLKGSVKKLELPNAGTYISLFDRIIGCAYALPDSPTLPDGLKDTAAVLAYDTGTYAATLLSQLKGSSIITNPSFSPTDYADKKVDSKSGGLLGAGISYIQQINAPTLIIGDVYLDSPYTAKGSFLGASHVLTVDINGIDTKPNVFGKDLFLFYIDASGSVVPAGSKTFDWLTTDGAGTNSWNAAEGDYACNATTVTTGYGCAGSVLDNNQKVIYN